MLSVVVLDILSNQKTSISSILETAYQQRKLPIKRLTVMRDTKTLMTHQKRCSEEYSVFVASFDSMKTEYIEFAMNLRSSNENIFIVFVVDRHTDISMCVRPSVRLSGILFIPLEKERVYQTIEEVYVEYIKLSVREEKRVFTIKSGGEYYPVNIGDISFFEAVGKKIALNTSGQEISFYSNFDSVLEQLPDWFVRCHKGYVVNIRHIEHVSFTNMLLTLKDKCMIPISRTYRDNIRACLKVGGN
jgi:DNA-binding LytR/AlgR family response regulator